MSQKIMAMVVSICLIIIAFGAVNPAPVQDTRIVNSTFARKVMRVNLPKPAVAEVVIDDSELACLTKNLYFEAGNQSIEGMEAVAFVTVNRTKTKAYPQTICGVVEQHVTRKNGRRVCQFSWYCDGKDDEPNLFTYIKTKRGKMQVPNLAEQRAWANAEMVARQVLEGKVENFIGKATHYHATYVNPSWNNDTKRMRLEATVGTHVFYTDVKLKMRDA